MKLELSAHPDFVHVLGAMGGIVVNVWLKLAIYCGAKWVGNPYTGNKCRPPGHGHMMGGLCVDAGGG
jgi:hypothetical protein